MSEECREQEGLVSQTGSGRPFRVRAGSGSGELLLAGKQRGP